MEDPSISELKRLRAQCAAQLAKALPRVFEQYELLSSLIHLRTQDATGQFPADASRYECVLLCLIQNDDWMTKRAVYDRLTQAGKIQDKSQRGTLNTSVNYHEFQGHIQILDKDKGLDALLGLVGWAPPS